MILFYPSQIRIRSNANYGKWFARMVSTNTVTTGDLARELSHGSSVTEADILAVLIGLEDIVRRHLINSETVRLERLGTLRVALRSHLADKAEDVSKNLIYGYRVVFQPEMKLTHAGGAEKGGHAGFFTRRLIRGVDSKALRQPTA